MSSLPLYDVLAKDTTQHDITTLSGVVSAMPDECMEVLYALIVHHTVVIGSPSALPYGVTQTDLGLVIPNIALLPYELTQIMMRYAKTINSQPHT